jgi:hypothetical protein
MAAHWSMVPRYGSYGGALATIVRTEGVTALWSGLRPTLLGIVPYAGLSFATYNTLKAYWSSKTHLPEADMPTMPRLCAGGIAGLLAQSATYPLDVVRRRMQVPQCHIHTTYIHTLLQPYIYSWIILTMKLKYGCEAAHFDWNVLREAVSHMLVSRRRGPTAQVQNLSRASRAAGQPYRYTGAIQALRLIYAGEGITGLYKGLPMNWIKGPIAVATSFVVNDYVKGWLRVRTNTLPLCALFTTTCGRVFICVCCCIRIVATRAWTPGRCRVALLLWVVRLVVNEGVF